MSGIEVLGVIGVVAGLISAFADARKLYIAWKGKRPQTRPKRMVRSTRSSRPDLDDVLVIYSDLVGGYYNFVLRRVGDTWRSGDKERLDIVTVQLTRFREEFLVVLEETVTAVESGNTVVVAVEQFISVTMRVGFEFLLALDGQFQRLSSEYVLHRSILDIRTVGTDVRNLNVLPLHPASTYDWIGTSSVVQTSVPRSTKARASHYTRSYPMRLTRRSNVLETDPDTSNPRPTREADASATATSGLKSILSRVVRRSGPVGEVSFAHKETSTNNSGRPAHRRMFRTSRSSGAETRSSPLSRQTAHAWHGSLDVRGKASRGYNQVQRAARRSGSNVRRLTSKLPRASVASTSISMSKRKIPKIPKVRIPGLRGSSPRTMDLSQYCPFAIELQQNPRMMKGRWKWSDGNLVYNFASLPDYCPSCHALIGYSAKHSEYHNKHFAGFRFPRRLDASPRFFAKYHVAQDRPREYVCLGCVRKGRRSKLYTDGRSKTYLGTRFLEHVMKCRHWNWSDRQTPDSDIVRCPCPADKSESRTKFDEPDPPSSSYWITRARR